MDKAASKGVIHKNQAANRKSGIMRLANTVVTDADRAAYVKPPRRSRRPVRRRPSARPLVSPSLRRPPRRRRSAARSSSRWRPRPRPARPRKPRRPPRPRLPRLRLKAPRKPPSRRSIGGRSAIRPHIKSEKAPARRGFLACRALAVSNAGPSGPQRRAPSRGTRRPDPIRFSWPARRREPTQGPSAAPRRRNPAPIERGSSRANRAP